MTAEEAERAWLVRVMWRAFPEATSETDLARRVADYLTKGGKPVDRRTVRYWLRQETAPGWGYIVELLALAGVEAVTEFFFGTGDRGRMQ